jgi:hypothetical protein
MPGTTVRGPRTHRDAPNYGAPLLSGAISRASNLGAGDGQAQQVYDALTAWKDIVQFSMRDGAQIHDAPMAPQHRNEVVFDWLDDQFR